MTPERAKALTWDDDLKLTQAEMDAGWHFCWEYDGLLVGPGMLELENCTCPYPSVERAKAAQGKRPVAPVEIGDVLP